MGRKEFRRSTCMPLEGSSERFRDEVRSRLIEDLVRDVAGVLESGLLYVVSMDIGGWQLDESTCLPWLWRLEGRVVVGPLEEQDGRET